MSIIKRMFSISSAGDQRAGILYVPDDYNSANKYPLLVFSHGTGEAGDGTLGTVNLLFNNGSPIAVANNGNPMAFVNPFDGKTYKFIVLALQGIKGWCCQANETVYCIQNDIQKNYNINPNAIFKTGLSAGGEATWEALGGPSSSLFAGGIPMSTPAINGAIADLTLIPKNQIRVWAFHGTQDTGITDYWNSVRYCTTVGTVYSHLTSYNAGHCCWSTYYNPTYKESFVVNGKTGLYNIYEIMLASMKGSSFTFSIPISGTTTSTTSTTTTSTTTKIANTTLQAVATATPSGNTAALSGINSTGSIQSWWWDVISRPLGSSLPSWENGRADGGPSLPSAITKMVYALANGQWTFKLNIQDKYGTTSSSSVSFTVTGDVQKIVIFDAILIDGKHITVYNDYSYTLV